MRFAFILVLIVIVSSVLVFLSVHIPPNENFWFLGFISPIIPLCILINLGLVFYLGRKKSYLILLLIFPFLVGFQFISSTFSVSINGLDTDDQIRVIGYNVSGFKKGITDKEGENALLDWLILEEADILCFQEFFNDSGSDAFNSVDRLAEIYPYYYISSVNNHWEDSEYGVAIFSKFPIANHGEILFNGKDYNRAAFADIVIGDDTIRVLSAHLESMQLKQIYWIQGDVLDKAKKSTLSTVAKIKSGLIERSYQADVLISFIKESPYPVIISGDFNHTPYSYVYNEFRKILSNSFESSGNGFGFTYSGNKLFFLRIDHQFYDADFFTNSDFKTYNSLKLSDHYPIMGSYRIK